MFCISLRPNRKIKLVYAPPRVAESVQKVVNEVDNLCTRTHQVETATRNKLGVWKFTMAADILGRRELATMGQLFCIKIIEDLHKMGYDLDNGSHPQIPAYNEYNSTCNLWFKKVTGDRPWVKVIYVALEKLNKIILINHNDQVKSIVEEAVENAWPLGIKRHKQVEALGHELHEIKMNSSLWQTCGGPGTGEPDIDVNRIVDKIIDNLGKIKIRSVGVIKINGQTSIFLTSPGLEVVSFPDPLAIESEAENLSRLEAFLNIGAITPLGAAPAGFAQQCPRLETRFSNGLEVLHTGVPSRFAQEEEGIRVWSVEALDLEDVDVRRPAQNVAGTETVRELGEDIASGLPTYEEAMRGRCKM